MSRTLKLGFNDHSVLTNRCSSQNVHINAQINPFIMNPVVTSKKWLVLICLLKFSLVVIRKRCSLSLKKDKVIIFLSNYWLQNFFNSLPFRFFRCFRVIWNGLIVEFISHFWTNSFSKIYSFWYSSSPPSHYHFRITVL